jgi:phosphate transport system substrate-binding protein
MKKRIVLAGVLLITLFWAACSRRESRAGQKAVSIQIKGSDTMVNLGQVWAEEFNKIHPNMNIAVTGGGSGTGVAALINGTCDIAESSRAVEEKEITQAEAKGFNSTKKSSLWMASWPSSILQIP